MKSIEKLKGIRPEEAIAFRDAGIKTVEQLWQAGKVAQEEAENLATTGDTASENGISLLAKKLKVGSAILTAERLAELLSAEASGALNQVSASIKLVLVAILAVLLFVLGLATAIGGSHRAVVVAAVNLKSGQTLQSGDLSLSEGVPGPHLFTDTSGLLGLELSQDIQPGKPLHYEDVLRAQYVATSDLMPGTLLTHDTISLTWTTYQQGAITEPASIIGYATVRPVKQGQVILATNIATGNNPITTTLSQDAISATLNITLPTVISSERVLRTSVPRGQGSSSVPLDASELESKHYLAISASVEGLGSAAIPSTHIVLLLSHSPDSKEADLLLKFIPLVYRGAPDSRSGKAVLVVALTSEQLQQVLASYSGASVLALRR